jgi:hypothetical protein
VVRRRLAMIAEASRLLTNLLDDEAVLSAIADLMVPDLADWCIVDLVDEDGTARLTAGHVDPAKIALILEMRRRFPLNLDRPYGIALVLRSGEPVLYPRIDT